jgi:putative holliday junction resolvase
VAGAMGRIMAIDYGTKRVGIAVTDPSRIIATGLGTVHSQEVLGYMTRYFEKEEVDIIVVGEPKKLDNTATDGTVHADNFVKQLKKTFPAKAIERLDERFTSLIAKQTMLEAGLGKEQRKNKGLVDEISAVLILQQYLEMIKNREDKKSQ